MISTKTVVLTAPPTAERILEFFNDGSVAPTVIVENLDDTASAAIKYQESNDGQNWSDVPNSTATVNPGDSFSLAVVASQARIALHAGGNVSLLISVVRQVNSGGAPLNLGYS